MNWKQGRAIVQGFLEEGFVAMGYTPNVWSAEQGNEVEVVPSAVHEGNGAFELDAHDGAEVVERYYRVQLRHSNTEDLDALGTHLYESALGRNWVFEQGVGGHNLDLGFYTQDYALTVRLM